VRDSRWVVGDVGALEEDDRFVALDLFELRAAQKPGYRTVPFHELLGARACPPAKDVFVAPPTWRGYGFVELLEWMACARLGKPGVSTAVWRAAVEGGATGVRRILERRGWQLDVQKRGREVWMSGKLPEPGAMPEPVTIPVSLDGTDLALAAGWGVFAGKRVDDGTSLLFQTALAYTPVTRVADIGTGSGVLAASLVAGGHAAEAVATDVDAVALYLARRNADAAGALVKLFLEDDPRRCPGTPLSLCNIPTHAQRANTELLSEGLAARTSTGPVLVVVHASLEGRYTAQFQRAGTAVRTVRRAAHAVLELTARAPQQPANVLELMLR